MAIRAIGEIRGQKSGAPANHANDAKAKLSYLRPFAAKQFRESKKRRLKPPMSRMGTDDPCLERLLLLPSQMT
jgi:hypothetical protein